jgi:Fur family ferric uptake transcriptional regulator
MDTPLEERQSAIAGELKRQGLRMTLPRRIIIGTLAGADTYLTAEEIYHKFHRDYPGVGLATVYRTLVLFHKLGIVTKLEVGEGKARYELAEVEHHHLIVCEKCHKVVKYSDFTTQEKDGFADLERLVEKMYHFRISRHDGFADLERLVEKMYHFRISRHVVQYYGVCPECIAKE